MDSEALLAALPDSLAAALRAAAAPAVWGPVAVVSLLTLVGSALALPWLIARLPADWLVRPLPERRGGAVALATWFARNVAALLLLLAGIAMLVLPGQGLLTIVAALVVADLPGKHRLERRLLGHPSLLAVANRLRARAGVPPLRAPHHDPASRSPPDPQPPAETMESQR